MKISKELDYPFSASRGNIGLTKEQRSESKIIAYMHEIDIQPYLILSHFIIVILHKYCVLYKWKARSSISKNIMT